MFKVLKAKYIYVRVQDGSISQKVYGYVPIKTRWQAMQSVDHEIDSELDDIEMMSKLKFDIRVARNNLHTLKNIAAPGPGELENIRNTLEAASGRLNPRWLIDKFFLKFSILIASDLVNIGKVRNADEVLGMAEGFCVRRTAECEKIISGLENGIRRTMRHQFAQKDLRIKWMIESYSCMFRKRKSEKSQRIRVGIECKKRSER